MKASCKNLLSLVNSIHSPLEPDHCSFPIASFQEYLHCGLKSLMNVFFTDITMDIFKFIVNKCFVLSWISARLTYGLCRLQSRKISSRETHHHHYHQIMLIAWILLSLSHHPSLSVITLSSSSRLFRTD